MRGLFRRQRPEERVLDHYIEAAAASASQQLPTVADGILEDARNYAKRHNLAFPEQRAQREMRRAYGQAAVSAEHLAQETFFVPDIRGYCRDARICAERAGYSAKQMQALERRLEQIEGLLRHTMPY